MRWLRLYDDTINDPKILKLPEATRWHWIAMLCIASKNDGSLPALDDVCIQLRVTAAKATEIIATLVKAGLLDKTETGFAPHNWNGRQYKSDVSNERVKRYRERKRNVTVTPPETETENRIQKDSEAIASGAEAPLDPSEPEREFFSRGKQILGKSSGGQLAKLLNICGHNVALARSKLELGATKQSPAEFVAGVIRAGPVSQSSSKPLTEFQRKQAETNDVRSHLRDLANGGESRRNVDRVLSGDSSKRPEDLRRGTGPALLALSGTPGRGSG